MGKKPRKQREVWDTNRTRARRPKNSRASTAGVTSPSYFRAKSVRCVGPVTERSISPKGRSQVLDKEKPAYLGCTRT